MPLPTGLAWLHACQAVEEKPNMLPLLLPTLPTPEPYCDNCSFGGIGTPPYRCPVFFYFPLTGPARLYLLRGRRVAFSFRDIFRR